MLCRSRLAVPLLALLSAALLAGCGGGGQTEGSGDGGGGQDQQQQEQPKKEAQETKIAVGNVIAVQPDRRRMVVQPSQQVEGPDKVPLNVRKTAEITLGDEKAEMGDIAEGQQAQAEYVVKNDVNRAVSVQLFEAEEQQGEGTSN
jgi:hypothetical protein